MVIRLALAALLCLSGPGAVLATPARIIILRHGEKADKWKLCDIGKERADALAANYLGRQAANSLFASGGVETLNRRTKEAARDLMVNTLWQGKTVVMVWEHKHIANKKLEERFPGEAVTLRQLLKLNQLEGVPETWPSGTYDYFWIVEYANRGSAVPTRFRMVKQELGAPYDEVPSNDWDQPNGLEAESGCDLKGAQD